MPYNNILFKMEKLQKSAIKYQISTLHHAICKEKKMRECMHILEVTENKTIRIYNASKYCSIGFCHFLISIWQPNKAQRKRNLKEEIHRRTKRRVQRGKLCQPFNLPFWKAGCGRGGVIRSLLSLWKYCLVTIQQTGI